MKINIAKFSTYILVVSFIITNGLCARIKSSFKTKSLTTPKTSYTKKSAYADFGKPSKVNGLPKVKGISGHCKRTSKGFTYVNPYARSK